LWVFNHPKEHDATVEAARIIDFIEQEEWELSSESELLKQKNIDEVADPTRDASPCFRDPKEKCLLEETIESTKAIHKRELRDWALGKILVTQAKKGLTAEVKKTEKLAIDATDAIGSSLSQVWMLGDLATENIQAGQMERAASAFNRGIAITESNDNVWSRAHALAKLATTLHDFR